MRDVVTFGEFFVTILKPKHRLKFIDDLGIKGIDPPLGGRSPENLTKLAEAYDQSPGEFNKTFEAMFPDPAAAPKAKRTRK